MMTLKTAVVLLESLRWLSGQWSGSGSGMEVESFYGTPKAGVMLGQGTYTAEGALAFFEFEVFKEEGGKVVLTPSPYGVPGVTFTATLLEEGHVVLENPDNDFPKLIEYKLLPDGSLYGKAAGVENGQPTTIEYVQHKVKG